MEEVLMGSEISDEEYEILEDTNTQTALESGLCEAKSESVASENEDRDKECTREEEYRLMNRKLMEKDQKEEMKIQQRKLEAKTKLQQWHDNRYQEIERKRKNNMERELLNKEELKKTEETNPWAKVAALVDLTKDRGEVGKMKSVLLRKKNE